MPACLTEALIQKPITVPSSLQSLCSVGFSEGASTHLLPGVEVLFPHLKNASALTQTSSPFKPKPLRVGVVFSGGQAPGGHNVLWGLYEAIQSLHRDSCLLGFRHGPLGFLKQDYLEINKDILKPFHNLGGFHLIGSGRTKIETNEQLNQALLSARALKLDAFVIIGGDDSNTNAAVLAEFFLSKNQKTAVIGVPKTIDGDLKNKSVEVSFGFDTAASLYSELIGNLLFDALSSQKYTHFVKLMGRSASHLTLECALRTHPNWAIIGEEVLNKQQGLKDIVNHLAQLILKRHESGKNYGLILIPEGLIDFMPEFKALNQEISEQLAHHSQLSIEECKTKLSSKSLNTFELLPLPIQEQLLLERDPHGNLPLSKIETGKLLVSLIQKRLGEKASSFFKPLHHYFGYEGRCSHPTVFDAHYCYLLGIAAALLAAHEKTGYMASVSHLNKPIEEWKISGLPITSLLHLEERKGKKVPVIKKALVNLEGKSFQLYQKNRDKWAYEDLYESAGPIQLMGSISDSPYRNFLLQTEPVLSP